MKFRRRKYEQDSFTYNSENKTKVKGSISENTVLIRSVFKDCDDLVFREFKEGGPDGIGLFLFYIDGMADKMLLDHFVMTPLMLLTRIPKPDFSELKNRIAEAIKSSGMPIGDMKEVETIEEGIYFVLSGETALFIDGYDKVIIISTKAFPARSITEPATETVIRGSRDGLIETLRMNTALIRRRIRDPAFKVRQETIGVRSQTDIAIVYMEDIVDPRVLGELFKRLKNVNIDAILDSGYVEQFIEENSYTPFPQIQTTERADVVAAAVYEGRIGIIVDNTPFVMIVPTTLGAFFQSPEDYYSRSAISTFVRMIRLVAGMISVIAPGLYIAITSFDPGMIPSKLALSIAAAREGVPFPAFIEAAIMEITFELLREAGVRLPRAIGATIGIVGGLVIGQAAVSANIVSPIMVIVVAVTAIAAFAIPNYELSGAFRLTRFLLMVAAAVYGLYGIVLIGIAMTIHLSTIKSFQIPYLSPYSPFVKQDMKDTLLRVPWQQMKDRPKHYGPGDTKRQ